MKILSISWPRSLGVLLGIIASQSAAVGADNPILWSDVDRPGGVAGLSSKKEISAAIVTPQIVSQVFTKSVSSLKGIVLPLDQLMPDAFSSFTLGNEAAQFGGRYTTGKNSVHRSISLYGQPYGNYNAGCTLCVFSTGAGSREGAGQAAITGLDYHEGALPVSQAAFDAVGFYHFDENWSARLTAEVASFDKGVATLQTPLTAEEAAKLHSGMYVVTNVVDPDAPIFNPFGVMQIHEYQGYLKSWDATHLYVYDWAVAGDGNRASGQIPDTKYLDHTLSQYRRPIVWVGVPNKHFAENEYMDADGSRVIGEKATTPANAFVREEFDFRAKNWSIPHSVLFHGWVTSFECNNCIDSAMSEDSFAYLVNGGGLPFAYRAQLLGDGVEFRGYGSWLGSDGPPEIVDENDHAITDPARIPVGTNHIMADFESKLTNGDRFDLYAVSDREQKTDGGKSDFGVRLGLNIGGKRDRRTGLTGGDWMGSLSFNQAGHFGGVCTLGGNTNLGFCVEGDGRADFSNDVTFPANRQAIFNGKIFAANGIQNMKAMSINGPVSYDDQSKFFGGQGDFQFWNTLIPGRARTEFVNVDPSRTFGGFAWYNVDTSSTLDVSKPMFLLEKNNGAHFGVPATFNYGMTLPKTQTIAFETQDQKGRRLTNISACDNQTLCISTETSTLAGLRIADLQAGENGSRSFIRPDGNGSWHVSGEGKGGGALSETSYTLQTLPTENELDGAHVWCSDCKLNGFTGVEVYWHAGVARWTDAINQSLSR